jgi:anthranilate/para-aminobenzoate synthase component I
MAVGSLDTYIIIRTALLKDGKAFVQAGGGWVNDSEIRSGISRNGEKKQGDA